MIRVSPNHLLLKHRSMLNRNWHALLLRTLAKATKKLNILPSRF